MLAGNPMRCTEAAPAPQRLIDLQPVNQRFRRRQIQRGLGDKGPCQRHPILGRSSDATSFRQKSFDLHHLQNRRHLLQRRRHVQFKIVQEGKQSFLDMKPKLREPIFEGSIHRGFRMNDSQTSLCCLGSRNPHPASAYISAVKSPQIPSFATASWLFRFQVNRKKIDGIRQRHTDRIRDGDRKSVV